MPDQSLPSYRAELARLGARLDQPDATAQREAIKAEIIRLYKLVDGELAALGELKGEILALISRWKVATSETTTAVEADEQADETAALRRDGDTPPPVPRLTPLGVPAVAPAGPDPAGERRAAFDAPLATPVVATPSVPGSGGGAAVAARAGGAEAPTAPAGRVGTVRADHLGASTFIEKGWNQIAVGDYVNAERSLRRALELAPGEPQTEALLGWALMMQEQYDDALVVFHRVLQRDPEHALARVNVGYICLKKGIWGEAIEHLTKATAFDTDRKATLYAHFYLGLAYLEREMFDDAQSFFRQTLVLGPNLLEANYQLGRACWFAGDRAGALAAWREGFTANKFNPWGKRCGEVLAVVEAGGEPPRLA